MYDALKKANLQVNKDKSKFCESEVKYLGYVVDADGLRADPDKFTRLRIYASYAVFSE